MILLFLELTSFLIYPSISLADQAPLNAFHIPLNGSEGQKEYILTTIDKLEHKFNALIIMVNNKVIYDRFPEISTSEAEDMRKVKTGYSPMSKQDLREIVLYAKGKGLEVIPEVKFLTHQEKFLRRSHPELMLNEVTYDPKNPKTYDLAFTVIDELIEIFKPRYFLIGHDEMRAFWRKKADSRSKIPTYKDFADDANKLAEHLKKKGVTPMMWGDMLLNPADFKVSEKMRQSFHGDLQDYYKAIDLLNKDIVIADWHYWGYDTNFPSVDYFRSKGFKVVGSTWKNRVTTENFAQYLCSKNDPGVIGMIATTWNEFTIRDTAVIDKIITDSAKAFSLCPQ